jgi:outer membrane lipoprotein-sorting protein
MKKHIMQKMFNFRKYNKNYYFKKILILVYFFVFTVSLTKSQQAYCVEPLTDNNKTSKSPQSKNKSSENFLEKYHSDVIKIEEFLNNIINLKASFIQTIEDSSVEGIFYLSRNKESAGKMRIEYLAQPKVVIAVNGSILTYHDIELDEISRLSTNTTPASFLTRPNIAFNSKDIEITNIEKNQDLIKISLLKKNRKDAGEFSLIFKNEPLEFIKMEVKNDLGQIISVSLKNIEFPSSIPNKFFIIKDNNF